MLITMVTYDHPDNGRSDMSRQTYESLLRTVDFKTHRLAVVDNASTDENTHKLLQRIIDDGHMVFKSFENIGTARAINMTWQQRRPGEHAVKMDNDVVIHQAGWADLMVEAFHREPRLGVVGLKRVDLEERPDHPNPFFRSTMIQTLGEPEIILEKVHHVIGTCQAYRSELLDEMGYLYQMGGLYGFDDADGCFRSIQLKYWNAFLVGIDIDHIDPGTTIFTKWKQTYAFPRQKQWSYLMKDYQAGRVPLYHGPEDE